MNIVDHRKYWSKYERKTELEFEKKHKLVSFQKKSIVVLNVRKVLKNPN